MMSEERIDLGEVEVDRGDWECRVGLADGRYRVWAEKIPEPDLADALADAFTDSGKVIAPAAVVRRITREWLEHWDLIKRPVVPDDVRVWAKGEVAWPRDQQAAREFILSLVETDQEGEQP